MKFSADFNLKLIAIFSFCTYLQITAMTSTNNMEGTVTRGATVAQIRPEKNWVKRHPVLACFSALALIASGKTAYDIYRQNSPRETCSFKVFDLRTNSYTNSFMIVGTAYDCAKLRARTDGLNTVLVEELPTERSDDPYKLPTKRSDDPYGFDF